MRRAGILLGEHRRPLQADGTRVMTLMMEGEDTLPPIVEVGDTLGHHGLAHGGFGRGPAEMAKAAEVHRKVDRWLVERFARLPAKLKSTPEGDGTLLDAVGVKLDRVADSTGPLAGLSGA
jgi:hypothetical protein